MKVKQTVTIKFHSAYTGYNCLEFTDDNGDEVEVRMSDDNYLDLAGTIKKKAERTGKERAEAAKHAAEAAAELTSQENSEDE